MDETDEPSDPDLISSVREGDTEAFSVLYERHVEAATKLARHLERSAAAAEDLVSEAFSKVFDALKHGRGPDLAFRPYLLTAVRNTAYTRSRKERRVNLVDDVTQAAGVRVEALSVPFTDPAIAGLERALTAKAFASLPERWQAVLWHLHVEGQAPRDVAPLLGLTPNGVSALAYRAREGMRQAYLQAHLAEAADPACRATAERLGAWVRGGLKARERAQVECHLDGCGRCRSLVAHLHEVNSGLGALIAPLVLGPAAVAYLAATPGAGWGVAATAAAGTSGSAGTGSSSVRQAAIAGVSGLMLVAAVVAAAAVTPAGAQVPATGQGVAAGTPEQQAPAGGRPAQTTPEAQDPAAAPPGGTGPAEPPPAPGASAPTGPGSPPPSPSRPPGAAQPPGSSPAPGTSPAKLEIGVDGTEHELEPGQAVDLPVRVRNTGGAPSEPISLVLRLPQGVHATQARAASSCSGDTEVVCTGGPLAPGESHDFVVRLMAEEGAPGGVISGSVGGAEIRIVVTVREQAGSDGVSLAVFARPGVGDGPVLDTVVRNTGSRPGRVSVVFDRPVQRVGSAGFECAGAVCTSDEPLQPWAVARLAVRLARPAPEDRVVLVEARIGSAVDREEQQLWWPRDRPRA
ncbi:sigma-70 family RNA polymerase sigma factor [Actinokineospora bangkokensis]|uniref:RNA polymerase subunit sigma n=1 Tax=Actinokineospora bangkokensis TaxID=1193682 RepID=A0A1Q9LQV0_9PSEU|nr:sigma-70 family RNA polymerase sigma factor [Actinokineospora bangkokensis]OLR94409.1 hypothetical protein BJP25_11655 [Actinokineospora bangkokensis]